MLEVANTTWGQTLGPSTELPLPVPADSWELEELVPGDSYQVAIAAVRGYHQTSWSPPSAVVVADPTTPAPPTLISVTSVSGGIDLSWTTPTGQNDSNITGYDIAWRDNSSNTGALHDTQVTGNSYEITDGNGIAPGDLVGVAISAVNPSGEGYPVGSSVIPDEGTPAPPSITSDVEIDANDDALTWTPGSAASTAGYWIDLYGYPASGSKETLPYELPPSTTTFTSGYLNGLAGSVTTCIQAANGTALSTLAPLGADCAAASVVAAASGGAATNAAAVLYPAPATAAQQTIQGKQANVGIPYQYFKARPSPSQAR
jgi:hypothetical protein